jgi:ABC-2 type transport system ATP-binding protein
LYGVPQQYAASVSKSRKFVELWDASVIKTFSGGMKRRPEIARGLLHTEGTISMSHTFDGPADPQSHLSYVQRVAGTGHDRAVHHAL